MNQISVETNVEVEATELKAAAEKQMEEALTELNSTQLALVGGGGCINLLG